eukprot:1143778-Pelagomonas_calceolata.AAC.1
MRRWPPRASLCVAEASLTCHDSLFAPCVHLTCTGSPLRSSLHVAGAPTGHARCSARASQEHQPRALRAPQCRPAQAPRPSCIGLVRTPQQAAAQNWGWASAMTGMMCTYFLVWNCIHAKGNVWRICLQSWPTVPESWLEFALAVLSIDHDGQDAWKCNMMAKHLLLVADCKRISVAALLSLAL